MVLVETSRALARRSEEKLSWYGHHVRLSTAMACPALTVRPLHCTAHPLAVV